MARNGRMVILIFLLCSLLSGAAEGRSLRVISLYPGHTDNIVAMGGAGMIVAVSENDGELPDLPRLPLKTGAEAVLALRPDVVLTRGLAERMNPNLSGILTRSGVKVVSLDPPSWDGFPDYLRRIAEAVDLAPEAGVERLAGLRASIAEKAAAAVKAGRARPRVFVEATSRDLRTCAPDSWAARLVELAGGLNAAASAVPQRKGSAVAPWGLERLLKLLDSGIDVYIVQSGAMNDAGVDGVLARPWAAALGDARVAAVPEAWLSRPSLLGLKRGGEELLRIFYGVEAER